MRGFGEACVITARLPGYFGILFFFILILSTAVVQSLDTYRFYRFIRFFTLTATILSIIYIVGGYLVLDLDKYSHEHTDKTGLHDWRDILAYAPSPIFFFTGIEMLPIIAHDAHDPRFAVPLGLIFVTAMSIVTAFFTYTLASGQRPGIVELREEPLPLMYGFANVFDISDETAAIFNIPFQIASYMIAQYFLCIIMKSMAESGLLPSFLLKTIVWPKFNLVFPVYSASFAFAISTLIAGLAWMMHNVYYAVQMNLVMFFSFPYYTLYIALFVTFITFRRQFSSLPRTFVSPFGVYGAYLGIAITTFLIIATCFYSYTIVSFVVYIILLILVSMCYLRYVHRHETFSGEEEKVFFLTYVIRCKCFSLYLFFIPILIRLFFMHKYICVYI